MINRSNHYEDDQNRKNFLSNQQQDHFQMQQLQNDYNNLISINKKLQAKNQQQILKNKEQNQKIQLLENEKYEFQLEIKNLRQENQSQKQQIEQMQQQIMILDNNAYLQSIKNESNQEGDIEIQSNWEERIYSFDNMELNSSLISGIYSYEFQTPSKIQQIGIRPIIQGRDIIAQAKPGTGKTATFAIGALQLIKTKSKECQALVLAPSRGLAIQIEKVFKNLGEYLGVQTHACIGGTSVKEDIKILEQGVHIIIGTPGRVFDMMAKKHIDQKYIKIIVVDEADEMLTGCFQDQIQAIFKLITRKIQVCIFSTIMTNNTLAITNQFMGDTIRILVKQNKLIPKTIKQYYIGLQKEDWKLETLLNFYENLDVHQSIIYCNKKRNVERITEKMTEGNFKVTSIHGEMKIEEKKQNMQDFSTGSSHILITTDLLAGIDIQQVRTVINFDLPTNYGIYLHRIGRSGRFGRKGVVINFILPQNASFIKGVERHYSTQIEELPLDLCDIL